MATAWASSLNEQGGRGAVRGCAHGSAPRPPASCRRPARRSLRPAATEPHAFEADGAPLARAAAGSAAVVPLKEAKLNRLIPDEVIAVGPVPS